jgi:hypothetical protein
VRIEKSVGAQFGAGGRALVDILDRLAGQQKAGLPVARTVSRRFLGAFGGAEEERDFDQLAALTQQEKDRRFLLRREVEQLATGAASRDVASARKLILRSQDPEFKQLLTENLKERALNLNGYERFLKSAPVKVRAQVIRDRLLRMDQQDRLSYAVELRSKGILTTAVVEQIGRLNAP